VHKRRETIIEVSPNMDEPHFGCPPADESGSTVHSAGRTVIPSGPFMPKGMNKPLRTCRSTVFSSVDSLPGKMIKKE